MNEDVDRPLTDQEVKEKIKGNLEYIQENFPKHFSRKIIDKNIETLLDATLDIFNIPYSDHGKVSNAWEWASLFYLEGTIKDLKNARENTLDWAVHLTAFDYDFAYDMVFNHHNDAGML